MKLCKDCKFCVDPGEFARCEAPQNETRSRSVTSSMVTGEAIERRSEGWRWIYCSTQRDGWYLDALVTRACGQRARWWQAR